MLMADEAHAVRVLRDFAEQVIPLLAADREPASA
jgi:hypothetical protein